MEHQADANETAKKGEGKEYEHFYRFHLPHVHLSSVYGDDWFSLKAEAFARFFGTPVFLLAQTAIVAVWILINVLGLATFDVYPFILLNLAFSLQAAYAAPLILLAQTRQADRDKAHALADAEHREALHRASEERQAMGERQTALLVDMVKQNTLLTETVKALTERVEVLTLEVHKSVVPPDISDRKKTPLQSPSGA
ncbi:DUF1003 domain-containing protein [Telmatospirillum sp.]|uniref:DUF1003 domain-containing protein n=1 Tax=Telmatospirillum sp. TaxID=2079197 RepID=UPI0028495BFB|nr:DUF1003 domain-containing protein [Telmatospirillum sp.]MDR3437451.1 DUF1003 domain-containing protein [Telmatospirillum sp.]